MTLTERGLRDYRAIRARNNTPATIAHAVAANADRVRAFVREHVVDYDSNTGHAVVDIGDGATYRVRFEQDDTYGDPDGDCYDDADIAAWRGDEWHYYVALVECVLPDGREGFDSLGGIDAGDHWRAWSRLDTDDQVWSAVLAHSMLDEARDDAEKRPVSFRYTVTVTGRSVADADRLMSYRCADDIEGITWERAK